MYDINQILFLIYGEENVMHVTVEIFAFLLRIFNAGIVCIVIAYPIYSLIDRTTLNTKLIRGAFAAPLFITPILYSTYVTIQKHTMFEKNNIEVFNSIKLPLTSAGYSLIDLRTSAENNDAIILAENNFKNCATEKMTGVNDSVSYLVFKKALNECNLMISSTTN